MNVLSLFDGISCGQVAFERAEIIVDNYFASEINPDALMVTNYHFPNTIQLGNVVELTEEKLKKLPRINILIGGSPCQDISLAKSKGRKNLEGERSRLFFEYIRILEWLKKNNNPKILFLLENVKAKKEVIAEMSGVIGVNPILINSVLVSAQRRERYYWTNIEGITQPTDKGLKIRDIIFDDSYMNFTDARNPQSKRFTKNYIQWDASGKGYDSQSYRAYYKDGTMCTIPKSRPCDKLNIWLGNDLYRRCHPIEAERLQTLPDNYTEMIKSPGKRMGLVGDGWTVDIIAHIFKHIQKDTFDYSGFEQLSWDDLDYENPINY